MNPHDIISELSKAGYTQTDIAKEFKITNMAIHHVIYGRSTSARIKNRIAEIIKRNVGEIWINDN